MFEKCVNSIRVFHHEPDSEGKDMLIAVIADIHGNLEAFQAVLAQIRENKVARIISLGDNVGYGPDPEQVMALVREEGVESVLGNHEMVMKDPHFIAWFNPLAQQAVLYTRARLSEQSLDDIRSYPKSRVFDRLRFVHGAPPASPLLYLYQLSDEKLAKRLDCMEETLCFAGHTHDLQLIEYRGGSLERKQLVPGTFQLDSDVTYLVNAGSVGQPRDGDNKAKYVLYDTTTHVLTVRAVPYDAEFTASKIIRAGLPEQFARRLL